MKRTRFWLVLLFLVCPGLSALAEDQFFVHGEITALDLEQAMMTIRPGSNNAQDEEMQVRLPRSLVAGTAGGPSADCLAVGRQVRVWAVDGPAGTDSLVASEIRGCGRTGCADPTGVRARLARQRRGQNQGMIHSDE